MQLIALHSLVEMGGIIRYERRPKSRYRHLQEHNHKEI